MNRVIGQEFVISLSEFEQHDILKVIARAKELVTQERFHGKIQIVYPLQDKIAFIANSDVFEHDNQEKNQIEKARRRASRFLRELGIYVFGNKVATSRNLWEIQWRPQIQYLMTNTITHDVVDNHLAAVMLMIPCIDRAFTFEHPQGGTGYTSKMLKWAFPEDAIDISAKDYRKCINEMRDGLVNGLKHDSFLRGNVYINNSENNPHPFYLFEEYVIVNPHAFWTHVCNKLDTLYADKPRNLSIGS